jgi:hypothetical protein
MQIVLRSVWDADGIHDPCLSQCVGLPRTFSLPRAAESESHRGQIFLHKQTNNITVYYM